MKDEIKGILSKMERLIVYGQYNAYYDLEKQLLDYITNFQQKVDQYENPDDMTLFYMWLDEKAKDKMKCLEEEIPNTMDTMKRFGLIDVLNKLQELKGESND